MAKPAVNRVVLKAVWPPVLPLPWRLTVWPSVPLVWSQAYAWSVTTPSPVVEFGMKRIRSLPESSRAVVRLGVPKAVHVEPPLVEYCQVPLFTPVSPTTATPGSVPLSMSWKLLAKMFVTLSPVEFTLPGSSGVKAALPGSHVGA